MNLLCKTKKRRLGYNLMELALVLGVAGITLGAIWQISTIIYDNVRTQRAYEETITVVNNVRGGYAGRLGIPRLGLNGLSASFIQENIIPADMERLPIANTCRNCNNRCADTPWGKADPSGGNAIDPNGTFRVCDWDLSSTPPQTSCKAQNCATPPAGSTQLFAVDIRNISVDACVQLTAKLSGPAAPAGIYDVNINGCNILEGSGCGAAPPTRVLPVTAKDMSAHCSLSNSRNILRLVYQLRLPTIN